MDINVRGYQGVAGTNSGSPASFPSTILGNAYVIIIRLNNGSSHVTSMTDGAFNTYQPFTDNSGNTIRIQQAGDINSTIECWFTTQPVTNIANGSVTIASSNGADTYDFVIYALNNMDTLLPMDVSKTLPIAAASSFNGPTLSSNFPGIVLTTMYAGGTSISGLSGGFTGTTLGGVFGNGYKVLTAPGSTTPAWILGSSHDAISASFGFRADPPPCNYSRKMTIDHTKCGSSDSSVFPVLVSITAQTYLKTVANGGKIQNTTTVNGITVPTDLLFSSDANGINLYPWEIESYDGTAGTLVAWVLLPTVSHSADTVFYMLYSSAGITGFQGGVQGGVWNTGYAAVWHMSDNAANTTVFDWSPNANAGTNQANTSTKTATAQIDGGLSYNGSSDYTTVANSTSMNVTGNITISGWIKSSVAVNEHIIGGYNTSSPFQGYGIRLGSVSNSLEFWQGSSWVPATSVYDLGSWVYFAVTCDGSTARFYRNGATDGTGASANPASFAGTRAIAARADGLAASLFNGTLDEIRISTLVRSADWILTEYNNQNSPSTFITIGAETLNFPLIGWMSSLNQPQPQDNVEIIGY